MSCLHVSTTAHSDYDPFIMWLACEACKHQAQALRHRPYSLSPGLAPPSPGPYTLTLTLTLTARARVTLTPSPGVRSLRVRPGLGAGARL